MVDLENNHLIEAITQIANARLHKKHPDITIQEWQTKEILEALILFTQEYEKEGKDDIPRKTNSGNGNP